VEKTILDNATILCPEENGSFSVIDRGFLVVEEGVISEASEGEPDPSQQEKARMVDSSNLILMPGLVNTHGHAAMTLLRSYADDLPLMQWLQEKIWPIESKLSEEHFYWGTLLSMVEMIRSGTTTFTDMYFGMERVAQAAQESGMRAVISQGLFGLTEMKHQFLNDTEELINRWQGACSGRITVILGPHAPYTCPPDYLKEIIKFSQDKDLPLQIHLSETRDELKKHKIEHDNTPVQHLEKLGLLERPVLAAHCVHLSSEDIKILAENNVGVSHNPGSNLKLGCGIAPLKDMLQAGIKVGLGTDGASSNNNLDMFEEMRLAALLPKGLHEDPTLIPAPLAIDMATRMGADILFQEKLGKIKAGHKADIIGIDKSSPRLTPLHSITSNLVYSATGADVKLVMVDGNMLMEKGELLTLDEEKIKFEAQRSVDQLVRLVND